MKTIMISKIVHFNKITVLHNFKIRKKEEKNFFLNIPEPYRSQELILFSNKLEYFNLYVVLDT